MLEFELLHSVKRVEALIYFLPNTFGRPNKPYGSVYHTEIHFTHDPLFVNLQLNTA